MLKDIKENMNIMRKDVGHIFLKPKSNFQR